MTCSTPPSRPPSSATSRPAAATPASTPRPTPSTTGPGTATWSAPTSPATRANQQATVKVEDHGAPVHRRPAGPLVAASTSGTTSGPTRAATCTCWPASTRPAYTPGAGAMGADHPIAWCQDYDGGRSWYTGGGHTQESYTEPQFLSHLLGGIQTAAGVAGRRLRRLADRELREGHARQQHQQPDGAGHRPGRPGVLRRARRPGADHQAGHRHHGHRGRPGRVHRQRGRPARPPARPELRRPTAGSTCTTPRNDGAAAQPAVPVHRHRRHHRPGHREGPAPGRHAAQHLLPRRRQHDLRQRRQPLPRHRRQHQPVRVGRATRRSTSGPAGRTTTPSAPPATPTTCAARCCGSTRRTTAPTPSRPATCSPPGTAKTRPEIYAHGLPQPVPDRRRPEDQHALRRPTTGRTPARPTRTAAPRARSSGTSSRTAGNYGWPYCLGANYALQRLHTSRPARAGRSSTAPRR